MIFIVKYEISKEDLLLYKNILQKIKLEDVVSIDTQVTQPHDKTIKKILEEKEEVARFLKQYIKIDEEAETLEEYKNEFITNLFRKSISDIVYKIKNKEVFYIIEHQSKVDKKMPYRMLKYSDALIGSVQVNNQSIENPIVVPIVIYTGDQKWNVETSFAKTQLTEEKYKEYKIDLRYRLIDINKISREELMTEETRLSKMMLIEKCRTSKEIRNTLIEILQKAKDEKTIEWVKDMLYYTLSRKLDDKVKEELKEIIREMEEKKMDEEWERRIQEGDRREREELKKKLQKKLEEGEIRGEKRGIQKNMIAIIKNMLKLNEDEDKIIAYTNATKADIEKAKRTLKMQNA